MKVKIGECKVTVEGDNFQLDCVKWQVRFELKMSWWVIRSKINKINCTISNYTDIKSVNWFY